MENRRDGKPASPQQAPTQSRPTSQSASAPAQDSFQITAPSISLPKGGGAIRGIGEKFAANPVTGTGSMSVPIATSPGRGGFGPQLSLSYDSGAGNGPFGLGWSFSLPSITRKTDKGLPRYVDHQESDVFMLAGAEDLVPLLDKDGHLSPATRTRVYGTDYDVHTYRPRIEGLFALIERWTQVGVPTNMFWRVLSRDNVTTWYGKSEDSRIFDPNEPTHIFQWIVCETHDDKGNVAVYQYKREDAGNVTKTTVEESNRRDSQRTANCYLDRIRYGNTKPYLPTLAVSGTAWTGPNDIPGQQWMFEVVFDYSDPTVTSTPTTESTTTSTWLVRKDPFSSYRAGFEIRTYRLCRRVLMFHHFEELGTGGYLVRSTDFQYERTASLDDPEQPGYTVLKSVTQRAYQKRQPGDGTNESRKLPPVTFEYSKPKIDPMVHTIDSAQLVNLPVGTQGPGYRWLDLDGEGLSGVLTEQAGGWYYKPNRGDGQFGPLRQVVPQPAMAVAAGSRHQFMDLAGDGAIDVVDFSGPIPGFHERDQDEGWTRHVPFASLPNIDWQDANLRFVDLTGDGHADALITEHEAFTWYPSLDERGFAASERTRQAVDEDDGPRLVFADGTQTIFLADMCGDGLTDLVRIRNGEVCYWPNLGYGRFGRKVTLGNSPRFEAPDLFDPTRIRLTDLDGSGPVDLIYLGRQGAQLYFNRSGNRLSDPFIVALPVATENLDAVQVADLLGNGTACLVWNSHLPADATRPVRYIDLMAGLRDTDEKKKKYRRHEKPHLLIEVNNNLGATTKIEYTPSTRFYLQDLNAGTPWATRLPFPVHCVSKVTVHDKWRGTAFSSTYSYHHGYFDGTEREFRGFGRVEQIDIEDYGSFQQSNIGSPWITDDKTLYQAPVKTITWYHTGADLDRQRILKQFEQEYFPQRYAGRLAQQANQFHERSLPEPELPPDLTADEWREALRACKGMVLRQEIYELDIDDLTGASPKHTPVRLFSATTHNCRIQRLQRKGEQNRHAVFLVTESEALTYHYELAIPKDTSPLTPDPRIAHRLNLRHDEYGNPQQTVMVGYRRWQAGDVTDLPGRELTTAVQAEEHIAYTEMRYSADVLLPQRSLPATQPVAAIRHRRLRLPCETLTYELKTISRHDPHYFEPQDFMNLDLSETYGHRLGDPVPTIPVASKPYHDQSVGAAPQKRIVELTRTLYFDDAGDTVPPTFKLPFGQHGPRGLKYEDYKLALTDGLLSAVFGHATANDPLADKLSWELSSGVTPRTVLADSGKSGYIAGTAIDPSLQGQYWIRSGITGFANDAHEHYFLPERYTDPFGNETTLKYDQRDLFIYESADAKGNVTAIARDASGRLRFDYRVLAPLGMVDLNGNGSEVACDILGMPTATAVKGKGTEGDSLDVVDINPSLATRIAYCTEPFDLDRARQLLGRATARQIYYFGEVVSGDGTVYYGVHPPCAATILREQHAAALSPNQEAAIQVAFEYSDGSGNLLAKKSRTEPISESPDGAGPAQLIIDDFTSGPFQATYTTRHGEKVIDSPPPQTGTMASGQRTFKLQLAGETGQQAAVDIQSATGFRFTSDMGVGHRFDWGYGEQRAPLILDVHEYNALRFHFLEVPRGLNFNVLLFFRGQLDNYAQLGVNIPPHTTPFDLDFSFDNFRGAIADPTRPPDFSQVTNIAIVTQSGGYFAGGGESFALRAISAVSLSRWITSGKTILNNKGKPVKHYEPYFTDSQVYHDPIAKGVTPVMYYDAVGRLIRTELPDGSLSRVEFSPWQVRTFDQNDTVTESRWYRERLTTAERGAGATPGTAEEEQKAAQASPEEKRAARLAALHAETPAETHLDSLGREVVSLAHNRTPDANGRWQDEQYLTFSKLDAEGKPLWIVDARGNKVMQYIASPTANHTRLFDETHPDWHQAYDMPAATPCYDIAGNLLFQHSMDAGDRWMLNDAAGKPMFAWDVNERHDSQNNLVMEARLYATDYDALHRPLALKLKTDSNATIVIERFEYQDALASPANNLNGQLVKHYDASGLVETVQRDFKGNVQEVRRTLVRDASVSVVDWQGNPVDKLETDTYVQRTEHDALNRMVRLENWHLLGGVGAVYIPTYNERGLLKSEAFTVRGAVTQAIQGISYNAKGQKESLKLGNGTITRYDYDATTFRLKQLRTTRLASGQEEPTFPDFSANLADGRVIQQLRYTYDPVGNITEIYDEAYKPVFFANVMVEPRSQYEYDALYRLISATGRENSIPTDAPGQFDRQEEIDFPVQDGNALRNYTQRYQYDRVGNIQQMRHLVTSGTGSWTRDYAYAFDDPAQPASNRLWQTWTGSDRTQAITYGYDTHGNMQNLARTDPRYNLKWDHRDMIREINLGGGAVAYYQYDSGKQRTRKRIVNKDNAGYWERIYLGGYERYRRYNSSGTAVVEEIETHHVFEGEQRVLMIEDVLKTDKTHADGRAYKTGPIYRYQYSNHLGSACLELDHEAAIISYEEYHPYGTSAYRARQSDSEAPAKRYRYTGMERDEESGLSYHTARYYAQWLGRWTSSDPLGTNVDTNFFRYASGNTITRRDRNGGSDEYAALVGDLKRHGEQLARGADKISEHMFPHKLFEYLTKIDPKGSSELHKAASALLKDSKLISGDDYKKAFTLVWEKSAAYLKTYGSGDLSQIAAVRKMLAEGSPINALAELDKAAKNALQAASGTKLSKAKLLEAMSLQMANYAGLASFRARSVNFLVGKANDLKQDLSKVIDLARSSEAGEMALATAKRVGEYGKKLTKAATSSAGFMGTQVLDVIANDMFDLGKRGLQMAKQSKLGKFAGSVLELGVKKGGKIIPAVGTGVGIGLAANEFSKGNYAGAFVEAAGASEIPIIAQVADIGSLAADVTWLAKDAFDPEQKIEQWWYEHFLK